MAHIQVIQDGVAIGLRGVDGGAGQFMRSGFPWNAASVDTVFYVATRSARVEAIMTRVTVAGTDAGAVTAVVRKVPSGTAISAGTVLHTGTVNLKGTANTNQALTLSTTATDLILAAGDAIAINFTGVLTASTGQVTVGMNPV